MARTVVSRTINAPADLVFRTVAHIDEFSKPIPEIKKVEVLTESSKGAGTRFKETRVMRGREATVELKVTEYEENKLIRLVSDEGGTVWETVFTVKPDGESTHLEMVMEAKPYKIHSKLLIPMIQKTVNEAVERDMDSVKDYCENR